MRRKQLAARRRVMQALARADARNRCHACKHALRHIGILCRFQRDGATYRFCSYECFWDAKEFSDAKEAQAARKGAM